MSSRRSFLLAAALVAGAACRDPMGAPPIAPAFTIIRTITVTQLGTLGGNMSLARAVNSGGQVIGVSNLASGALRGFLWQNGVMTDLGIGEGTSSWAAAINDLGQVAGGVSLPGGSHRAVVWDNGTVTDLGTLGGAESDAMAINDLGLVAGFSSLAGWIQHAFLWENGVMHDLGTLGGNWSYAYAVNNNGQVVGTSATAEGATHAFLWQDGVMTDLGTLGGTYSDAAAINDAGQIVGISTTASEESHAFRWEAGTMTDLGTLSGGGATAWAINGLGQIAGESEFIGTYPTYHAVLWDSGTRTDLGLLAAPADFPSTAYGINDAGQIVGGMGVTIKGWEPRAVLWSVELRPATPEEETAILSGLVAGLIQSGVLPQGQGGALQVKIDVATRQLNRGNSRAAAALLGAFIHQVEALIHTGVLDTTEAAPLLDAAANAIAQLGG